LPISERVGDHPTLASYPSAFRGLVEWPLPQDLVGFLTQMRHQRSGGPSYLLGERRMTGWWYYYFVAMAVKVPLSFWLLAGGRVGGRRILADSNLDWGQGLRGLARLQREDPRFRNLTVYYFGDTQPEFYDVAGICHVIDAGTSHPDLPETFEERTKYIAA